MLDGKRIDEPRFTYGDYVQWQGDERWELIDGVAFLMSPAPTRAHQHVAFKLAVQIERHVRDLECEVYVAPFDVRLPDADEPDEEVATVVQPDVSVICDPAKLDQAGCRGAPDWVIEVLSPRTAARDQVEKRDLYQRHGVRELWLVHPTDRVLTAYRLDAESGRFGAPLVTAAEGKTAVAAFPGFEIEWADVFPRV